MTDFKELARIRRSRRQYTEEQVTEEELKTVLRAALMAPSAKSLRQWNFTYTRDKVKIQALSEVREHGSGFLANAPVAIAVSGPAEEQDTWIEDCSLAAVSMQYQAQDLGLGTCWCQIRGRESRTEGVSADDEGCVGVGMYLRIVAFQQRHVVRIHPVMGFHVFPAVSLPDVIDSPQLPVEEYQHRRIG